MLEWIGGVRGVCEIFKKGLSISYLKFSASDSMCEKTGEADTNVGIGYEMVVIFCESFSMSSSFFIIYSFFISNKTLGVFTWFFFNNNFH